MPFTTKLKHLQKQ